MHFEVFKSSPGKNFLRENRVFSALFILLYELLFVAFPLHCWYLMKVRAVYWIFYINFVICSSMHSEDILMISSLSSLKWIALQLHFH